MKIRQRGFSIIEMMVGLTIGLLGLLAVTRVMITFNQQRNSTVQTMEAQSNGTMALFLMERDLAQGGYGLMPLKNCEKIQWFWDPPAPATPAGAPQPCAPHCGVQQPFTRGVAPAIITTHSGYSDEISVQYALSKSGTPGSQTDQPQALFTDAFKVSSTVGFAEGDLVIADVVSVGTGTGGLNEHFCTMSRLTRAYGFIDPDTNLPPSPVSKILTLEHDTTYVPHPDPHPEYADYNPTAAELSSKNPDNFDTSKGWKIAPVGTLIANLGGFVSKRYMIDDDPAGVPTFYPTATASKLMLGSYPNYNSVELGGSTDVAADGIVYMKAQYGLDTQPPFAENTGNAKKGGNKVLLWTNSLASITDAAGRIYYDRILAVRVGIVARSPLLEKDPIVLKDTNGNPITDLIILPAITGVAATGAVTWPIPDAHYRYKVYYTIVPFKNVLWTS